MISSLQTTLGGKKKTAKKIGDIEDNDGTIEFQGVKAPQVNWSNRLSDVSQGK